MIFITAEFFVDIFSRTHTVRKTTRVRETYGKLCFLGIRLKIITNKHASNYKYSDAAQQRSNTIVKLFKKL